MHRTLDEDLRRVKTPLEREALTVSRTDVGLLSERGECQERLELRASVPVGARGGGN